MSSSSPPRPASGTDDAATERGVLEDASSAEHRRFMAMAMAEAEAAARDGDVPVGAVVVSKLGEVISLGRNRREVSQDPTSHAEIEALREASRSLGTWRLLGATVYVTLEPCPMCAGALVNARVARVVFACTDPKGGAVITLFSIGQDPRLNHRFEVISGVMAEPCSALLRSFFVAKRRPPP